MSPILVSAPVLERRRRLTPVAGSGGCLRVALAQVSCRVDRAPASTRQMLLCDKGHGCGSRCILISTFRKPREVKRRLLPVFGSRSFKTSTPTTSTPPECSRRRGVTVPPGSPRQTDALKQPDPVMRRLLSTAGRPGWRLRRLLCACEPFSAALGWKSTAAHLHNLESL
jgi:hypothetical protein